MMKQEFEDRMKFTVSWAVYEKIEQLYMEGTEDKDTFCKRCKRQNTVVTIQQEIIKQQADMLARLTETFKNRKRDGSEQIDRCHDAHREVETLLNSIPALKGLYYHNNNYLMGLARFTDADDALEIMEGGVDAWRYR